MKKILVAIVVFFMVLTFTGCGKQPDLYPTTAVVTELKPDMDMVIATDFNGIDWAFFGIEDYEIGDMVSMIMDGNHTEDILDDEIVSVRYSGWLNGSWGWDGEREVISIER